MPGRTNKTVRENSTVELRGAGVGERGRGVEEGRGKG